MANITKKLLCFENSTPNIGDKIALTGLYVFALGYVLSKAAANLGFALLFVGFLINAKANLKFLWGDRLFTLSIFWFFYLIFTAARGATSPFSTVTLQLQSFLEVFSFGTIFLGAWATRGESIKIKAVFALALTGLIARIIIDSSISLKGIYLNPSDMIFSTNKNFAAVLIDAGLVGVVLLFFYLLTHKKDGDYRHLALLIPLVIIFFAWGSVSSRAAWISLTLSLLLLFLFILFMAKKNSSSYKKTALFFGLFLIVFFTAAWVVFGEQISSRILSESDTWRAILSGRWEEIPPTSIGLRIYMWHYAYELWLQSPMLGHGTSVAHLLSHGDCKEAIRGFNNFHNVYLELLVRVGLVGVSFFIFALYIIGRATYDTYKTGGMHLFLFLYLFEVLLLFLLNSFSVGFLFVQHGWQYVFLFGSIAYGYRLRSQKN